MIADSAIELAQYRLLVLHTAWVIDTQPHGAARTGIAMCKVQMAKIYHDIVQRAIQLHGSYGATNETFLAYMWTAVPGLALADGPTEVHRVQVSKAILKSVVPYEGVFPPYHIPTRRTEAQARYADILGDPALEAAE
jgi:acyl-CoA dehydrogenase